MKLQPQLHAELANRLNEAQKTRVQLEHFSRLYPEMDMEDSYAIQQSWMNLCLMSGRTVIGHKIGLTSRAMQIASQITEPDYGTLLDDMLFLMVRRFKPVVSSFPVLRSNSRLSWRVN